MNCYSLKNNDIEARETADSRNCSKKQTAGGTQWVVVQWCISATYANT